MKIIQLTDLHLSSDKSQKLFGVVTYDSLNKIIDHLLINEGDYDAIILTGDISQDETIESYQLANEMLIRLNKPIHYIHGNHDYKSNLELIFNTHNPIENLSIPYWDFISVDTVEYGKDRGFISDKEFSLLKKKISESKENNIVLVMHHHCLKLGTPLVDDCMLLNNHQLLRFIDGENKIKLIMCGHAHGNYKLKYNNLTLEVCPAVCFQWKKGTKTPSIENISGYRKFSFFKENYSSKTIMF